MQVSDEDADVQLCYQTGLTVSLFKQNFEIFEVQHDADIKITYLQLGYF